MGFIQKYHIILNFSKLFLQLIFLIPIRLTWLNFKNKINQNESKGPFKLIRPSLILLLSNQSLNMSLCVTLNTRVTRECTELRKCDLAIQPHPLVLVQLVHALFEFQPWSVEHVHQDVKQVRVFEDFGQQVGKEYSFIVFVRIVWYEYRF